MGRQRKRHQSSHQRTPQFKKSQIRSPTIQVEISPERLIEQGNLQGAIDLLISSVSMYPQDDDKRRLLGNSLFTIGQYAQSIDVLLLLQEKNWADYANIGTACLNEKDWEQAKKWLEASLQDYERARTYFLLALAYKGENTERKDSFSFPVKEIYLEALQQIVDLLQHARTLPQCPLGVYSELREALSTLARRKTFADPSERERETAFIKEQCSLLLEEAFQYYPENTWTRLDYAEDLLSQEKYETVLLLLRPVISKMSPSGSVEDKEEAYTDSTSAEHCCESRDRGAALRPCS